MSNEEYLTRLLELVTLEKHYFNRKPLKNDTLPMRVKEILNNIRTCEYECGANVTDQRSQITRREAPYAHWLTQCRTCGLYQHPQTGEMINQQQLQQFYAIFILDKMREA